MRNYSCSWSWTSKYFLNNNYRMSNNNSNGGRNLNDFGVTKDDLGNLSPIMYERQLTDSRSHYAGLVGNKVWYLGKFLTEGNVVLPANSVDYRSYAWEYGSPIALGIDRRDGRIVDSGDYLIYNINSLVDSNIKFKEKPTTKEEARSIMASLMPAGPRRNVYQAPSMVSASARQYYPNLAPSALPYSGGRKSRSRRNKKTRKGRKSNRKYTKRR